MEAGVRRVVYLGGLAEENAGLSQHLRSRHEVGHILRDSGLAVIEFRASIVIGSGSLSFEMIRSLVETLPVMVTPRWVGIQAQPISIQDLLAYLERALEVDPTGRPVYEIGGADRMSYGELMREYARQRVLRRTMIPVPVLTPRLSSLWIGLVTPLPVGVARPLVDSLRNEVIVRNTTTEEHFDIQPMPFREAVEQALQTSTDLRVDTRWSDATTGPALPFEGDPSWSGGSLFIDRQVVETRADPADLFWAFSRIGGDVGYYGYEWAWELRGILDVLVGGVGLQRGRRHPEDVRVEDTVDFWRVTDVAPDRVLQLSAEMRLPGEAWLEWRVEEGEERNRLHQTAYFRPKGLTGRLYWYAMLPFHRFIFTDMARRIASAAEGRGGVTLADS